MSWDNQMFTKKSRNLVSEANQKNSKTLSPYTWTIQPKLSSQLKNCNITYDTELWDDDYHVLSPSGYSRHLEADAKMLSLFLKHLIYFIKKSTL